MLRGRGLEIMLALVGVALLVFLMTRSEKAATVDLKDSRGNTVAQEAPPAKDFSLMLDKQGLPPRLFDLKDKVVVLDFWASWCGPCRQSIPELEALYKKYKDQGLVVIGVSTDDQSTRDQVPPAIKRLGITYPVNYAEDIAGLRDMYPFESIPALVVVDKQHRVRIVQQGYNPQNTLDDQFAGLLKE